MMVIMLAAVSYHYLVQPSTLVATDRDISISFEELETKYGWNGNKGVYNAGKTGGGVRFTNQGSELRGKRGFGNLQIEGSLLITNSGVVLRKGSTLLFR